MAFPEWVWSLLAVAVLLVLVGLGLFYKRPKPSLPEEDAPTPLADLWGAALSRTRSAFGESLRGLLGSARSQGWRD